MSEAAATSRGWWGGAPTLFRKRYLIYSAHCVALVSCHEAAFSLSWRGIVLIVAVLRLRATTRFLKLQLFFFGLNHFPPLTAILLRTDHGRVQAERAAEVGERVVRTARWRVGSVSAVHGCARWQSEGKGLGGAGGKRYA